MLSNLSALNAACPERSRMGRHKSHFADQKRTFKIKEETIFWPNTY
jgi:hypothetical protein